MELSDENITRKLDELLKNQDYEKAPADFSDKVLSGLHPYLANVKSQYTPLISKKAWILVGVLLMILSFPVNALAARMAIITASVPELLNLIFSTDSTLWHISSAQRITMGIKAP